MNCPAQLHSERNIYQLFKYLQLRLWFYDGPKSTEVEPVSPNLGHTFPILLFCHLYYSSWCSVNWFSKVICLITSPKIIKSDRFLTRLVFWFIHVIAALAHNWWWERVAGDDEETWISLTVPVCPLGGFSRSWDLVFASSLFGALLLSCWHSLTIFLKWMHLSFPRISTTLALIFTVSFKKRPKRHIWIVSLERALQIFTDLFIMDYRQAGKSSSPKKSLLPFLVPNIKPVHTSHLTFAV